VTWHASAVDKPSADNKNNPQITQMNADSQKGNREPQTYAIIGAAMEVHRQLGHGFLENVYQEALAIDQLTGVDDAQIINELKATGFNRGVLLNFGLASLEYKRLVFNPRESAQSVDTSLDKIKNINLIGA